jgi:3-hydroxyisobutyrate dehydrogenase-like beta-hydroxyacid dehydrogenase
MLGVPVADTLDEAVRDAGNVIVVVANGPVVVDVFFA